MYQRDSFLTKETNHDNRFSFISGPIFTHKTRWSSAGFVSVRLIGLVAAPPKTFKKLSTPDKESFSEAPKGV